MARKRKRSYGVLTHQRASYFSKKSLGRTINVKVSVQRNIGASKNAQFVAEACIARKGKRSGGVTLYSTRVGARCGSAASASTPTKAAKAALRSFSKSNWNR